MEYLLPTVIRISGNRETIVSAVEKSRLPFRESIKSLRQSARSKSGELESTFNLVVSEAEGDNVSRSQRQAATVNGKPKTRKSVVNTG